MTPKEKAIELFDKFTEDTMLFCPDNRIWEKNIAGAKKCALIAVDEILEVIIFNKYDDKYWEEEEYWEEVKQEINKI